MEKTVILGEILKDDVELCSNYFDCYLKKYDYCDNKREFVDITNVITSNVGDIDIYARYDVFQGTLFQISDYVEKNYVYGNDYEMIIVEDNSGTDGIIYKYGNHGRTWEVYAKTGGIA